MFEGLFECIRENNERYQSFSDPIKKVIIKIVKEGNKAVKTTSYKIKFIDSIRSMAISLSNHVYNLTEGIHKSRCKDCNCFLEYESVTNSPIKYKCLSFNKDYSKKVNEELKEK